MRNFFEFMEKIRTEKMLFEQDMNQQQPMPQDAGQNQMASDTPPEQQDAGVSDDSGLSPTAHDDNFSKLIDIMKQALPDLKPENKKLIDEFLKSNNLTGGDEPKEPKQEEPQPDQNAPQAQTGMGDQSGMPAQMPTPPQ